VQEHWEVIAENMDADEGGGNGNLLEGIGGCSVSRSLLQSDSLD